MTGRRRASLMVTCLGDLFFPEVGVSIVRVLQRLGVAVDVPPGQTCCGLPLFNSGYHTEAAAVAGRTVSLFADSDHVVGARRSRSRRGRMNSRSSWSACWV